MARVIETRAVISVVDKTGSVFSSLAAKFKGLEKSSKSIGNIKGTGLEKITKDWERFSKVNACLFKAALPSPQCRP